VIKLDILPETSGWSADLATKVKVDASTGTVELARNLTPDEIKEVASGFLMEDHRKAFEAAAVELNQADVAIFQSPAQRGTRIAVPWLCLARQGELEWLDDTHFLERPWSLKDFLNRENHLPDAVEEKQAGYGEIDLTEKGKVDWSFGSALADELKLIDVTENWSEARLVDWFDRNIPHPDLVAEETGVYINHLLTGWLEQGWTLGRMVRERYPLRGLVEKRINACRQEAKVQAFQEVLFGQISGPIQVSADQIFVFDNDRYPARWVCERSAEFSKHFHEHVGELTDKGEEFACAQFIEQLSDVEVWIRNLERQPDKSFWLPTATDRFYPDFVCKLTDGRILVVEYKGKHLFSNDDSKEKRRLGELWAERSNGTCLFVMPDGPDLEAIRQAL